MVMSHKLWALDEEKKKVEKVGMVIKGVNFVPYGLVWSEYTVPASKPVCITRGRAGGGKCPP